MAIREGYFQGHHTILVCIPLGKVSVAFVIFATALSPPQSSEPLTVLMPEWLNCSPQKPKSFTNKFITER